MATDKVEREIVISASRERVWAVLTEPGHVARWFGDLAEIDLRPGGRAVFGWAEYGRHEARIERVEPPGFFSYRWAHQAGDPVAGGTSTLVEFTLERRPGPGRGCAWSRPVSPRWPAPRRTAPRRSRRTRRAGPTSWAS